MRDGLVSIIMPAYRSADFIAESIASVQAQTYSDWELLVTDDCSPDGVRDVVLGKAAGDPRIRYFRLAQNSGPAVARNNSVSKASGRYLAFLDSDDCWKPEKLERQLQFMASRGIGFSFTEYQRMKADGTLYPFVNTCPDHVDYKIILKDTCISTLTVMLDRKVVGNIALKAGWGHEDFILWLDILRKGEVAHCLRENLASYRVMEKSVSSNKLRAARWVWQIYRRHENLGFIQSAYYLANYAKNAVFKRIGFV